jgi:hypothetical protein
VSGPARYTSKTDKPIEHITLVDQQDVVIGYLYANDEDDAAGWVPRPAAGFAAQNLATPWILRLVDAKKRGLKPTAALDEVSAQSPGAPHTRAQPGSRQTSPSIAALRQLAGADTPPDASPR